MQAEFLYLNSGLNLEIISPGGKAQSTTPHNDKSIILSINVFWMGSGMMDRNWAKDSQRARWSLRVVKVSGFVLGILSHFSRRCSAVSSSDPHFLQMYMTPWRPRRNQWAPILQWPARSLKNEISACLFPKVPGIGLLHGLMNLLGLAANALLEFFRVFDWRNEANSALCVFLIHWFSVETCVCELRTLTLGFAFPAMRSALSFPGIPICPGIQMKSVEQPISWR